MARLPTTSQAAAQRLVAPQVVASIAYREALHRASRTGADVELLGFSLAFQKELQRRQMPFYAHQYYRSKEQQDQYFRAGTSKARWGESAHNFGMAVDIVHFGRYWDLTRKEWSIVGAIGQEVARKRNLHVTWGGDWKFYDPAHWELSDWKERRPRMLS